VAAKEQLPLLARPYAERQRVVVVEEAAIDSADSDYKAGAVPAAVLAFRTVGRLNPVLGAGAAIAAVAGVFTLDAVKRVRERGLNVVPLTSSEAEALTFPPGHPKLNSLLYVGHPLLPTVYYPAAHFHRLTFDSKFNEAITLLAGLGATKIRVERESGWSREFAAKLSVPLGEAGGGRAKAGAHRKSSAQALWESTLDNPVDPHVPEGLVWYPHEPSWQTTAKLRLENRLQSFSLTLAYNDDFGVDASIKAKLGGTKIGLGGEFEEHQATTWRMSGTFASN
jgi:hypothetical protein